MTFFAENSGTILIGGILLVAVIVVLVVLIRDRKNGKHSCGLGCGSCPHKDDCHEIEGNNHE